MDGFICNARNGHCRDDGGAIEVTDDMIDDDTCYNASAC
jgi:hypothetical protein